MTVFVSYCRWVFLLLALAALMGSGCASTEESANLSERPWNAPQNWETGMGGMFNQYH
jgi:hypothetical protein